MTVPQLNPENIRRLVLHGKSREYVGAVLLTIGVAVVLKIFVVEAFHIPSASMERSLLAGDFVLVNKSVYSSGPPHSPPFAGAGIPPFQLPGVRSPRRGDVIVFRFPGDRDQVFPTEPSDFVKRCVAVAGDTVQIIRSVLYVNGKVFPRLETIGHDLLLPESFRDERMFPVGAAFNRDSYGPVVVPKQRDLIPLNRRTIHQWEIFIRREGHSVDVGADGAVAIDGVVRQEYSVERNYVFVMGDNRDNSLDSRFWGFLPEENIVGEAMIVYWSLDPDVRAGGLADLFRSIRWDRIGTIIQ